VLLLFLCLVFGVAFWFVVRACGGVWGCGGWGGGVGGGGGGGGGGGDLINFFNVET